jgi:hypothetical protein
MIDEDGITVQFCWLPDEGVTATVISQQAYSVTVEYEKHGILYREMFNLEDVIFLKEIHIPLEREEPQ